MQNYDVFIINAYLYAIFLIVSRTKINHKLLNRLKIFLVILFMVTLYYAFVNTQDIIDKIIKLIPLTLVLLMVYYNEIRSIFRLIGIKSKKVTKGIESNLKKEIVDAVEYLSIRKIGALISFERDTTLNDFIKNAYILNADFSSELIASIFIPGTPLHDGAVIVKKNIIKCAGAYYPSSQKADLPKNLGTRHRAGLGISELNDSLTIIVSEETGKISVAIDGNLDYDISIESLVLYIETYLESKN